MHPGSGKKTQTSALRETMQHAGGHANHPPILLFSLLFSGPWLAQVQRHGAKHDIKPG